VERAEHGLDSALAPRLRNMPRSVACRPSDGFCCDCFDDDRTIVRALSEDDDDEEASPPASFGVSALGRTEQGCSPARAQTEIFLW